MSAHEMLLVDDDRNILEVLQMRLEAMGFAVTATPNPEEALQVLGRRHFDVALFDLRMEPLDGIQLTRAAHDCQARLPILIMTAHGSIDSAVEAIKEGAFDYLTKPFVPDELRQKLSRAIAERRWTRDRELLRHLGENLASATTIERTLSAVAHTTMEATETERAFVFVIDDGEPALRAAAGAQPVADHAIERIAGQAIRRESPVRQQSDIDDRHLLAAPLLVDGTAVGALVAENPHWVVPTDDDLDLLAVFAAQAAVAWKNANELVRLRSGALSALGSVAAQVAHDLTNPLNGLKLQAYSLADRLEEQGDAEGVGLAQKMGHTIDQLASLVGDIRSFGKPKSLRRAEVSLDRVVEACLEPLADRTIAQSVEVELDLDDARPYHLDERELSRVMGNLLSNAVDAMPDGGRLVIRAIWRDGGGLDLRVTDDGRGMDEATLRRATDLFFSTKPHGTGLGLGIVQAAVDAHGGHLEIESRPDQGTSVRLVLTPVPEETATP